MDMYNPTKKHCAVWLFDCKNGNPNGDPIRENTPRVDIFNNRGLVTDVCLKRHIRNYLEEAGRVTNPINNKILIQENTVINDCIQRAYSETGLKTAKRKTTVQEQETALKWLLDNFIDLRLFGGVLSTGDLKAGQYNGPVQITFATSLAPIYPEILTITRCAATNKVDGKDNKTFGKKSFISYGLYRAHIFYSPCKDKYNKVTEDDLRLFWEAVANCFEVSRTAAKGEMATQGLYVFSHASRLGNYSADKLFNIIKVIPKGDNALSFQDYSVAIEHNYPTDYVKLHTVVN